jgi:hypothetical protein
MDEQPRAQVRAGSPASSARSRPPCGPGDPPGSDPALEEYLDRVYAPLVGVVPYAQRIELRAELREHLQALVTTREESGDSHAGAVRAALTQFGPPHDLARLWAREWAHAAAPMRLEPPWRAMGVALGFFGIASLAGLGSFWLTRTGTGALSSGWCHFLWLFSFYLLPLAAGLAAGTRARSRHALGAFFALALLTLSVGLPAGLAYRSPETTPLADSGLELAMALAFLWTPIGCGAAALGGTLRARLSRRPARWVPQ